MLFHCSMNNSQTIYDFSVLDIDGSEVSLEKYRGKPVVIVNVASNCGFTGRDYKELQGLYQQFYGRIEILAFPCNQFGNQEPGCSVDIKEFIRKKGITFDVFDKIDVNGVNESPLYKYLKSSQGGLFGRRIKWNFTKFLINAEGKPISRYSPATAPSELAKDIDKLF